MPGLTSIYTRKSKTDKTEHNTIVITINRQVRHGGTILALGKTEPGASQPSLGYTERPSHRHQQEAKASLMHVPCFLGARHQLRPSAVTSFLQCERQVSLPSSYRLQNEKGVKELDQVQAVCSHSLPVSNI